MSTLSKTSILLVSLFSTIFISLNGYGLNSHTFPIKTFEHGTLYKYNKIDVVSLKGNFFQMGEQNGALMRKKLHMFYKDLISTLVKKRNMPYDSLLTKAKNIFNNYPMRFREFFYGMAKTSGLTLNQHLIINAFEQYLFAPKQLNKPHAKCSAIALWNKYTTTGKLLFGRNYDFPVNVNKFNKYLAITVFNPIDSGIPTAVVTFTGTLNATTDLNKNHLFLELNNGEPSGGTLEFTNRLIAPTTLLSMMLDSPNLHQLNVELNSYKTNFSYIINVANNKKAYSYEWLPFAIKRRSGNKSGLLVATNHFVDPSWGLKKPQNDFLTITRREHLINFANQNKGKIDLKKLQKFMQLSITNGGATSYNAKKNNFYTGYQIITTPYNSTLWIRVPDYQSWTKINFNW